MRRSVESFIALETSDDKNVMVSKDGSLLTYVKIDGSRQVIGDEEYAHLIEGATIKIGARFDRQGHAMQVYFVRDPGRIKSYLETQIRATRRSAKNNNLDLEDVFDERVKHLSKFLTYEECYFVLWTRPSILTKNEVQRAAKEAKEKKWLPAGHSQFPLAALDALRTRHKSYISAVTSALDELGIKGEILPVHDALKAVRNNIFPNKANENWHPCLPGDPIPPRAPMSRRDMSDILWPPVSQQIAVGDARVIDRSIVQIGDTYWAGADMTLGPMDASPFTQLLNRLFEADIPWRISFLIEGGGSSATALRAFGASILS
ncbi:MAG: type IV secretion protein IcmB, partial [Pseudomonadota bacterium]|nr:type IV secretion protein IcmB [Pseudomonadota bacterium]